jgi:hypothetical protein
MNSVLIKYEYRKFFQYWWSRTGACLSVFSFCPPFISSLSSYADVCSYMKGAADRSAGRGDFDTNCNQRCVNMWEGGLGNWSEGAKTPFNISN